MGSPYGPVAEQTSKTVQNLRCCGCGKLLAELVTAPYRIACPRCKAVNSQG